MLTEAATEGKTDFLLDFKSNLIMGHMIPGGTGFTEYHNRVNKYLDTGDADIMEFAFND